MRALAVIAFALAACGAPPAKEFPPESRARFAEGCPRGDPKCDCMWDEITRTMTPADFDAAMDRFTEQGLMEPKLTAARLECREAT